VSEATDWLQDYLTEQGGTADSADVKREGLKAGHGKDALQRARAKLPITTVSVGFPRRTHWALRSSHQLSQVSGETSTTATTQTTTAKHTYSMEAQLSESSQLSQSSKGPQKLAPTEWVPPGLGGLDGQF
jgi:hypothetical protein